MHQVTARVVSVNAALPRVLRGEAPAGLGDRQDPAPGARHGRQPQPRGRRRRGHQVDHGGTFQAVHAYAAEDLAHWERELGKPIRPGLFGENLTTSRPRPQPVRGRRGVDDRHRPLRRPAVRTPCARFERWMGLQGFDAENWVAALRGVRPTGRLPLHPRSRATSPAGDPVDVLHVPDHGLTAGTVFRALAIDPALLPAAAGGRRAGARRSTTTHRPTSTGPDRVRTTRLSERRRYKCRLP